MICLLRDLVGKIPHFSFLGKHTKTHQNGNNAMTTTTTPPSSSSSSSFEDEIHATENFLSEKQLEEVDAFLNRYVRLNDAGKLSSSSKTVEDAFVSGTYFWSRDSQPQTAIERYCETLCSYFMEKKKNAFSSLFRDDDDFVGCEYWVQDVAHDEAPKAYHTDCVLEREEEEGDGELLLRKKHPLLSTVYYGKTERGGATVAFDEEEYEKMRKCVLVKPRRNRLFAFRGDMWHGVCRDENGFEGNEEAYQRVTLLVNFWKERPKCAGEFPREMFSGIHDSSGNHAVNDDDDETRREEIDLSTTNDDDERVFKMKSGERRAHFAAWEAQNPNAFLEPSASSSSIVLIEYTE
jgi:hypothetical protein